MAYRPAKLAFIALLSVSTLAACGGDDRKDSQSKSGPVQQQEDAAWDKNTTTEQKRSQVDKTLTEVDSEIQNVEKDIDQGLVTAEEGLE